MLPTKFLTALMALLRVLPNAQMQREQIPLPQATSTLAPPDRVGPDKLQLISRDHYGNKSGQIIYSSAKSTQGRCQAGRVQSAAM
jgi:hypothetical protein